MKKLLGFLLTLVAFFPPFLLAESRRIYISFTQGFLNVSSQFTVTPSPFYAPADLKDSALFNYVVSNVEIVRNFTGDVCTVINSVGQIQCPNSSLAAWLKISQDSAVLDIPPTVTCKYLEGATISDYHSSDQPYCADLGGGTFCIATCQLCITNSLGSYPFTVTAQSCSAPTGPDGGTGDGGGGDTGDGDTGGGDTGGGDSGGNPGGGNSAGDTGGGNSGGNTGGGTTPAPPPVVTVNIGGSFSSPNGVTNVNLSFEQDYSPITTRIDQTNQLLTQTNTGINQLNDTQKATNQLLTQTNTKLDGIAQGQANTNQLLTGLTDAVTGLNTGLGDINNALTSGTLTEGANAANDVNLPTDNQNDAAYQSVISAVSSEQLDNFSNLADNISGFESIPQLFNFAASNCAPLPFGKQTLDICSYAQTSRFVLNWVFIILLVIFLSRSIVSDLKNLKVS